jgi:hypothetical protein
LGFSLLLPILATQLTVLKPCSSEQTANPSRFSHFFADTVLQLRLITGRCKGADDMAGRQLLGMQAAIDESARAESSQVPVQYHRAAVLPFAIET